jgi:hypothetical protein
VARAKEDAGDGQAWCPRCGGCGVLDLGSRPRDCPKCHKTGKVAFELVDAIALRPKKPKPAPERKEGDISRDIMAALEHAPGLLLWRNSIGTFRAHGFHVRAGLPKGSADLVGILQLDGIPAVPFGSIGRFVALEVKKPGEKADPHQVTWLESVRVFGGFAAVVHGVEEARAAIARARAGALE